jgi:HAD superfamily hydrolase (TIGR01509 family)
MQRNLIIFDCDGVLIDSEIISCTVDAEELTRAGFPITAGEVAERFSGVPSADMLAMIENQLGRRLPADLSSRIEHRVLAAYRTDLRVIPGVPETLRSLGAPFCVASSSTPSKLSLGLVETGLFELFHPNIFSSSLVAKGKPAPDLFLHAASEMDARPEHCLVIEDSIAGITAARCAGMRAIGFVGGAHSYPKHSDNLFAAGAMEVCCQFPEITQVIGRLNGGRT